MARYCPYIDRNTVYLTCAECDAKICEPDTFFCLVTGEGAFADKEYFSQTLDRLLRDRHKVVLVTDGAIGVGSLAEAYGEAHDYPVLPFRGRDAAVRARDFLEKQAQSGIVLFRDVEAKEGGENIT